jgi:hypothetical protein
MGKPWESKLEISADLQLQTASQSQTHTAIVGGSGLRLKSHAEIRLYTGSEDSHPDFWFGGLFSAEVSLL